MPVTDETGQKGWQARRRNGTAEWAKTPGEWVGRHWKRHYELTYPSMGAAYTLTMREMARVIATFPIYAEDYARHFQGETVGFGGLTQEILEEASGVPLEKFRAMAESPLNLIRFTGKGMLAKWWLTWRTLRAFERFGVPSFVELATNLGGTPIKLPPNWWLNLGLVADYGGENDEDGRDGMP